MKPGAGFDTQTARGARRRWLSAILLAPLVLVAAGATLHFASSDPIAKRESRSTLLGGRFAADYWATEKAGEVEARNRGQGIRAVFDAEGIRIHGAFGPNDPSVIASLRLVGIGREATVAPIAAGHVVHDGARVEIHRRGLVEWYVNRPEGLEQGFTIESRPTGRSALLLDLDVRPATARLAGGSVLLSGPTGRPLTYQKLQVADANGARVPARFELVDPTRVRLVIDDRSAQYPIVVDPILTGSNETTLVSDQDSSLFGYTVAPAGDVNGDGYDDVIVGAYEYDTFGPGLREGAAFIYHGSANGVGGVTPANAATRLHGLVQFQYFGVSVAGAGDVNGDGYDDVIVGSSYTSGQSNEGAAFVFLGSANGVASGSSANAHAVLQGNQIDSGFGYSVASAGDVNGDGKSDVIVGAPSYDGDINGDGVLDGGGAFVFLGSASGIANAGADTAATKLFSAQSLSQFGFSVASAGSVNGDVFGDVIVGAYDFSSGQVGEGAAFIYHGSASGVASATTSTAATKLESDDPDGHLFDVASAGDVNGDGYDDVVVGIPLRASTDEGAVFIYLGRATGIPSGGALAATILISDQYGANFGARAASAGDVNNDGYADLVIGASRYDAPESEEGAVFVYLGRAAGIVGGFSNGAYRRLEVNDALATLGTSVASAGDVDGDGFSDIIGGAPYYGQNDAGAAFIWHGGSTGPDSDGDGLPDEFETGTGVYVSPTNTGTSPFNADSDDDGLPDGWEVDRSIDPNDASVPGFVSGGSGGAIQASDKPQYRWRQAGSVFAADGVAPDDLSVGPGFCSMSVPTSGCSELGSGCNSITYQFVTPPIPPTTGAVCCAWESRCEVVCQKHACPTDVCPTTTGPASVCQGTNPCVNGELNCDAPHPNACDAEKTRLLNLGVPACCFESAGATAFRWSPTGLLPTGDGDFDSFQDTCDNCPANKNRNQLDCDSDGIGDACDHLLSFTPCPEPGLPTLLPFGIVLVARLARFRRSELPVDSRS